MKKGEEIYVDYGDEYDWGDITPTEAPEPEEEPIHTTEEREGEDFVEDMILEDDEEEESEEDEEDESYTENTSARVRNTPATRYVNSVFLNSRTGRLNPGGREVAIVQGGWEEGDEEAEGGGKKQRTR